jgi:hypothetical protein
MINIVLWKWAQAGNSRAVYEAEHVNVAVAMLRRNIKLTSRIICITDDRSGIADCETAPLWGDCDNLANASGGYLPSCYRRLKLYDRATQMDLGIEKGERIISLDLDMLVTSNLDRLLKTEGRFVGWEMPGSIHAKVFNGSLQMFTAGDLQFIWSSFDPKTSPRDAAIAGFKGSDQSWLSWKLISQPGSVGLKLPDIASYPAQVRIQKIKPEDNKIIFFHGQVKPWFPEAKADTPWVSQYWKA